MPTEAPESRSAFFRQSGWMMMANLVTGILMWAVHLLAKKISDEEYAVVGTLLAMTMLVPVLPLQMVFTQQTARALATGREAQLARMIRRSVLALVLVWAVAACVPAWFHRDLLETWRIAHPAAFWVTLVGWLGALLLPVCWGVVLGKQDYFSLGWSMILPGLVRFGGAAFIVLALAGEATGIMVAVALSYAAGIVYAGYKTRDVWCGPGAPFSSRELLGQVVPLMLGFGACQFLFTADTMFVKGYFPAGTHAYVAAGTLARGLMWMVMPLAAVMFPKIVHSAARSEKSNIMGLTLLGTAALGVCGAVALVLLGPIVVRIVYKDAWVVDVIPLLPWYAAAVVPLSLANVLVNNLLGSGDYRPVPVVVLLAGAYGFALTQWHASFVQVLQVLGLFNMLFFLSCAVFTWLWKRAPKTAAAAAPVGA
jgi:hypothetical protein